MLQFRNPKRNIAYRHPYGSGTVLPHSGDSWREIHPVGAAFHRDAREKQVAKDGVAQALVRVQSRYSGGRAPSRKVVDHVSKLAD